MSHILEGQQGMVNMIDDVLVFKRNREEYDKRLTKVLDWLHRAGLTLVGIPGSHDRRTHGERRVGACTPGRVGRGETFISRAAHRNRKRYQRHLVCHVRSL